MDRLTYDHEILLLQGGGALGAYHCGVYEALADTGMMPTWMVGISIGAINSAIIAGNPPERRVPRLREFWDRVSRERWIPPTSSNAELHRMGVMNVVVFGVPGFFQPRLPPPLWNPCANPQTVSFYDTGPLKETLQELVDFDLINSGHVRLSLGSVNVSTGQSHYFDTKTTKIRPEHVIASGALPPGFPCVEIDGEFYWDGGLVSNTPITYVADQKPLKTALMIQVNLFDAQGVVPRDIESVMERMKDIQYCSKQRFSTDYLEELGELRAATKRLLDKLPRSLRNDEDVKRIEPWCDERDWTIAFLTDTFRSRVGQWKDAEFSRATVNGRWQAGIEAVRQSLKNKAWLSPSAEVPGIRTFHLPPRAPAQNQTPASMVKIQPWAPTW